MNFGQSARLMARQGELMPRLIHLGLVFSHPDQVLGGR
jgi:hypothetical protein